MLSDRLAHLFDRRATLEQLLAANVLQSDPRQTKTGGATTAVASALQSTQVCDVGKK